MRDSNDDRPSILSASKPPETSEPPEHPARRGFLQTSLASAAGAVTLGAVSAPALAQAQTGVKRSTLSHYHLPANDKTVHWGYFSKNLQAPSSWYRATSSPSRR